MHHADRCVDFVPVAIGVDGVRRVDGRWHLRHRRGAGQCVASGDELLACVDVGRWAQFRFDFAGEKTLSEGVLGLDEGQQRVRLLLVFADEGDLEHLRLDEGFGCVKAEGFGDFLLGGFLWLGIAAHDVGDAIAADARVCGYSLLLHLCRLKSDHKG